MSNSEKLPGIPTSWKWIDFGDVLTEIEAGKSFKCDERPPCDGEIGVLKVSAVTWGTFAASESKTCVDSEKIEPRYFVKPGDLLFSRANTINLVGNAVIVGSVSGKLMLSDKILRLHVAGIDPRWILFALRTPTGRKEIERLATGNQESMRNIGQERIRQIRIPLAPRPEQDRIVTEIEKQFARLDAGVEALKRLQFHLKRYRASVLKAACEGKLVPTEAELARKQGRGYEPADKLLERILKERRAKWEVDQLAKMKAAGKTPKDDRWKAKYEEPLSPQAQRQLAPPEGWTQATVLQLGFIASGGTPKGIEERVRETGEIPWLKVGDMNRTGNEELLHCASSWISRKDASQLGIHIQPPGTIVFPKRGGAIATNKKRRLAAPSCYDLNCMGIIPIPVVAEYIWWWFATVDLGALSDGANIPQINHGDIEPLVIPLPPSAEQIRIVDEVKRLLSSADDSLAIVNTCFRRAARLRQSVLKRAFEGKLVAQDPNDEPASVLLERIRASSTEPAKPKSPRGRPPKSKTKSAAAQ